MVVGIVAEGTAAGYDVMYQIVIAHGRAETMQGLAILIAVLIDCDIKKSLV